MPVEKPTFEASASKKNEDINTSGSKKYEDLSDAERQAFSKAFEAIKSEERDLDKGQEWFKKEAQKYRMQAYGQQSHFRGVSPKSEDARILNDSRKASESLAETTERKAETYQQEHRFDYNKLINKRNQLLQKFGLQNFGSYSVESRRSENEKEEKDRYR